ncbi:MAG TPA: hypothetical protein VIQ97_00790, partial [Prevotella sp.]
MHVLDTVLVRGATNVDAMTETYLATGNRTILDSIIAYSNQPNVEAMNEKLRTLKTRDEKGFESLHGVTFYETGRVPAILSVWSGKQRELAATENFIDWGLRYNELPFGLTSAQEWLSGAGSMHHIETCIVPASMWTYTWLMRTTGSNSWGDRIENVFFNAGPGSIARDFKTMSYYQTPNRFSETLPEDPSIPGPGDQKFTPLATKCSAVWAVRTGQYPTTWATCGWLPWTADWPTCSTARAKWPSKWAMGTSAWTAAPTIPMASRSRLPLPPLRR